MTHRFFEGKEHASVYQKYRVEPPDEVRNIILQYLDEKKGQPHVLAVDLGCGTGQTTRILAQHFKEVVGIDISECQLEEARAVPGFSNIEYRKGRAEELPFSDSSVDLVTASAAAHWFDHAKFLAEAGRVLKPRGCIALLDYNTTKLHYSNCGERLDSIYDEVHQLLIPYTSNPVVQCDSELEKLYSAIPFPDKERIEGIQVKSFITLKNLLGFIETWSMFQTYKKDDPQAANNLLLNIQKRFLDEMGVTSLNTVIEREMTFFGYLASKSQ
ncbi:putative methyltransferase DDB_G0268948 isoform X2 [Paralichthys olivaceus]|uniref:putative methyltransferase DDB_G0268948 isoform X2 n=1 Tax=Paralichthys olivaceus TaxID=8255 RepID=UPI00097D2F28|nr:PREDICTED: putative methyltransferase DDB_G0268948 [Paralichthys olivaceus]